MVKFEVNGQSSSPGARATARAGAHISLMVVQSSPVVQERALGLGLGHTSL